MSKKKFTIEVEMEEEWVDIFCSTLRRMEINGIREASEWVALFSDGENNFRPSFNFSNKYQQLMDKNAFIDVEDPFLVQYPESNYCKEPIILYDINCTPVIKYNCKGEVIS